MIINQIKKCIFENWERFLFSLLGFIFICFCFYALFSEKVTEAAAVFGLGFLSFIYANVARFKKFKGLGFEAELWEDKQKEAEDLIERLREVVSIYTCEVILGRVVAGRADNLNWEKNWNLYDALVAQHNILGQKIDFSDLKKTIDDYFLFDMNLPEINRISISVNSGKERAYKKIEQEFGSPIQDSEGFSRRLDQYRAIVAQINDPFEISVKTDLARHALDMWCDAKERLKRDFDVEVAIDPNVCAKLSKISKIYQSRPVEVTKELIDWANCQS